MRRHIKQKIFEVNDDITKNPNGLVLENEVDIKIPGYLIFCLPELQERGFKRFPSRPRFRYVKRKGRFPQEFERESDFWMVTNRVKSFFESIDPEAFAFWACEVIIDDKRTTGEYWLCDVVRILDALDEEESSIDVLEKEHGRFYKFQIPRKLVFRNNKIENFHIFRLCYNYTSVFCDRVFREACKKEKIKNIRFFPVIQEPFSETQIELQKWSELNKISKDYQP